MRRFIVNILLAVCFALPLWGKYISKTAVVECEIRHNLYTIMLNCNAASDTTYRITVWDDGRVYRSDDARLLLKLGDGTVLPLHPIDRSCIQRIDSMYYNNEGEAVFIHRNEMLYDYPVSIDELQHIFKYGILKVRIGLSGETSWAEIIWKRDEWGKKLAEAYAEIQRELAPDYVPPKKPTIYDDF